MDNKLDTITQQTKTQINLKVHNSKSNPLKIAPKVALHNPHKHPKPILIINN
jgi:hypothetical protein